MLNLSGPSLKWLRVLAKSIALQSEKNLSYVPLIDADGSQLVISCVPDKNYEYSLFNL